jgi:hypothetical protein
MIERNVEHTSNEAIVQYVTKSVGAHENFTLYSYKNIFFFYFKSPELISDPILMKFLLLKADFIAVYYHTFADLNFHTVLNIKQKLLIPNLLYTYSVL